MEERQGIIDRKLQLLIRHFKEVLYEDDEHFLEGMKATAVPPAEILKYRHWEWTQGVGLYGFWKYYNQTGDPAVLDEIRAYYEARLREGLPGRNVNTTAPMLTLSCLYEKTGDARYGAVCREWAQWLMDGLPRTRGGGFQHLTSDTLNDQELWDDTLFMAVLFLANMGRIEGRADWIEEAKYQFLLHIRYLADTQTGLFFHGWTFNGRHNFARGRWGRGNCWLTSSIPELLHMIDCEPFFKRYLQEVLTGQAEALKAYQSPEGMWHTLIDDPTSYLEASCTCGFGYGLLAGARMGLLVWSEMANAFEYSTDYARRFTAEWMAAVERDYNHPSIVAWTPLNESWGVENIGSDPRQAHHATALVELTKSLDPTRLVMSNDGWEQTTPDVLGIHDYDSDRAILEKRYADIDAILRFRSAGRPLFAAGYGYAGQPIMNTECGGISCHAGDDGWGYTGAEDKDHFYRLYADVVSSFMSSPVLQGFCYTQLTDVMQEQNGLLTYAHEPKFDVDVLRAINEGRRTPPV